MMRFLLPILLMAGTNALAAPATQPSTRPALASGSFSKTITTSLRMNYLVHFPKGYGHGEKSPLLICLAGSGGCGHDLKKIEGFARSIPEAQPDLPFVIVTPQLDSELNGWTAQQLDALLDHLLATYDVDPDRVYAMGHSWGAYGVWDWACRSPGRLAAIAPVSGEPNTDLVREMKQVPVWAFHGAMDKEVWPHEDQKMIRMLARLGDDAKLTMYPDLGHNAWQRTIQNREVFEWLLKHRR